jgi:hypothetical protein
VLWQAGKVRRPGVPRAPRPGQVARERWFLAGRSALLRRAAVGPEQKTGGAPDAGGARRAPGTATSPTRRVSEESARRSNGGRKPRRRFGFVSFAAIARLPFRRGRQSARRFGNEGRPGNKDLRKKLSRLPRKIRTCVVRPPPHVRLPAVSAPPPKRHGWSSHPWHPCDYGASCRPGLRASRGTPWTSHFVRCSIKNPQFGRFGAGRPIPSPGGFGDGLVRDRPGIANGIAASGMRRLPPGRHLLN